MTKRIIIPIENEAGLEAQLAHHFGRAPYFAIVELDEKNGTQKVKIEPNTSEHSHESFLAMKPDVVIAYAMGPGALNTFLNAGVTVLKANTDTVKGNIELFKQGKLNEPVGGCEHANEHHH